MRIQLPTLSKALPALVAILLSGCANTNHQVGLEFPAPNRPQMFAPVFNSTKYLDCLSAELHKAGVDKQGKQTVFLSPLLNIAGAKVGKVDLPPSLQGFVRASLDRVSSGFSVLSEEDEAQLRLNGAIFTSAPFRVHESELELAGLGSGMKVEAVDIGIQLYLETRAYSSGPIVEPSKGTGRGVFEATGNVVGKVVFETGGNGATKPLFVSSGSGVTVNLRLFSAERGVSAFVVRSGSNGVILGHARAGQEASPQFAIQSAVNVAVATLLKARAARQWGVFASCDLGEEGRAAIPHDSVAEAFQAQIDVRLVATNDQLCARLKPLQGVSDQGMLLEVSEFRGEGIELRRSTMKVASLKKISELNQALCLPLRGGFNERTEEVRFWFKTIEGRILGGAGYFFQ